MQIEVGVFDIKRAEKAIFRHFLGTYTTLFRLRRDFISAGAKIARITPREWGDAAE
jgi:hypothetical protein